ncbi:hypothetical protein BDK63_002293 [Halomonas campaniensis]|uniref:Uncharacterized protein n=1 Tax=Halomonas campaniensis TaxID=213554 RepID=A0A7W5K3R2_9GAMM|nr:DUF6519 domain-containing protein [Halomonas campaniensis]MBB3331410.1 hypothetical protein [Halomonas campaniensis]
MKTQISRYRRESDHRYDAVHQQQGRVLTDADWNALVDALRRTLVEGSRQALGSGMPANGGLLDIDQDGRPALRWGRVVVDGRLGEWVATPGADEDTDPLSVQADLPGLAPPAGDHVLYVDLWEREITALEDPSLADPALNGADTCTRTRTMVQLKWAPLDDDPFEEAAGLPACGDASLTLQEREEATLVDDPCEPQLEVFHPGIGDALFRLEVHHHPGPGGDGELVLKWSRENGAEAEARDALSPGFVSPDRVYEPFGPDSDSHLGIHRHDSAGIPRRGTLVAGRAPHEEEDPELRWLRRWDGYCHLTRSGGAWEWQEGWHRGTALQRHDSEEQARQAGSAEVHLTDDRLLLMLDRYSLELELGERRFISGDYWLATLREAAEEAARIELASATPLGIRHHYLRLYRVVDGEPQPLDDATRRRFQYLDLASLLADRIGYDAGLAPERWKALLAPGEGEPPENVQQALDALLVHLNSEAVTHHFGKCDRKPSVRSLLAEAGLGHWRERRQPLGILLNDLFCRLDARTLPYRARTSSTALPQSLDDVVLDRTRGGKIEGDLHVTQAVSVDGPMKVAGEIRSDKGVTAPRVHGEAVVAEKSFVHPPGAKKGLVLTAKDQRGNAVWAEPPAQAGEGLWERDEAGFLVPRDKVEGVRAVPELATGEHRGGWVTGVAWQPWEPDGKRYPLDVEEGRFDLFDILKKPPAWPLPERIVKEAREVLLHVSAAAVPAGQGRERQERLGELTLTFVTSFGREDAPPFKKHLYLAFGAGISSASDNIWLPVVGKGQVSLRAELEGGAPEEFIETFKLIGRAFVTGYR